MAEALINLAERLATLRGESHPNVDDQRSDNVRNPELPFLGNDVLLDELDTEAVESFVSDPVKTKAQLIELAAKRFSIPRSKLLKLTTSGVREAVLSALMNETSLAVITEEARRSGQKRQG